MRAELGCYIARMLPDTSSARQRAATSRARERRSFGRLRRRDSGRWEAAYVGPDARLYRAPATFEAKDDAIAWLSAERRMIELDTWIKPDDRASRKPTKGRTFGDYAEEWLANRRTKAGPLKPRTQADYRRLLDRHILPTFSDRPLRLIGSDEVNAWYLSLNSKTPTERAHAYQLLRAVFTSATKAKLIAENPCAIEGGGQTERAHTVVKVKVQIMQRVKGRCGHFPNRKQVAQIGPGVPPAGGAPAFRIDRAVIIRVPRVLY